MSDDRVIDTTDLRVFGDAVEKHKPPVRGGLKLPYILWGEWHLVSRKNESGKGYKDPELVYSTVVIKYTSRIPKESDLRKKLAKNHKILAYYFPEKKDVKIPNSDTISGWLLDLKSNDSFDPYFEVRQFCKANVHSSQKVSETAQLIEDKDAEIARLKAMVKTSSKTKKGGSKDDF